LATMHGTPLPPTSTLFPYTTLLRSTEVEPAVGEGNRGRTVAARRAAFLLPLDVSGLEFDAGRMSLAVLVAEVDVIAHQDHAAVRSEERRVGKGCASRGGPSPQAR